MTEVEVTYETEKENNKLIWCPKKECRIHREVCQACSDNASCPEYAKLSGENRHKRAEALDQEIESLKTSIFNSYFELGEMLKEIREGMYYKELGYQSLDEYADARHGFKYRKASYLIAIVENCEAAGLIKEDVRGIEWCLAPGTPVFINCGVAVIEDIKKGDSVLAHDGTWTKVEATEKMLAEKLVRFEAPYIDSISCTPEHRFLVLKNALVERKKVRNQKDTSEEDRANPGTLRNLIPEWIRAKNIDVGDYLLLSKPRGKGGSIPDWLAEKDEKFFEFLGWYVAEGYLDRNYPTIALGKYGERQINEIANLINSHYKIHTCIPKESYKLRVINKEFGRELGKAFGIGAFNKKIPDYFIGLPDGHIRAFLVGYWLGDGTITGKKRGSHMAATRSKQLAYGIWLLCLKMGFLTSVKTYDQKGVPMWYVYMSSRYLDEINDEETISLQAQKIYGFGEDIGLWLGTPVRKIETVEWNDYVYHLQTASETFSCPVVSHNSKMKELPELTEENREGWLKKAAELSVEDLKVEVKKSKGEDPPEKKFTMTFSFAEGQKEVVDRALEIAARLSGSDIKSYQLEIIAQEFLSAYNTEDEAAMNRFNNLYMGAGGGKK